MHHKEIDPRDPQNEIELHNNCGYCGRACELDYCNEDHFKARNS